MRFWRQISCLGLICFCNLNLSAESFVVPNDQDYWLHNQGKFRYIYPQDYARLVPKIAGWQQRIFSHYEANFRWHLDSTTFLVLSSNNNQVPNAFATTAINNLNVFYNGGGGMLENFAEESWMISLLSHEGAHLFQMDVKEGPSKWLHQVIGDSYIPSIFYILPIFTNPNTLLPTWLLEGNAVLNESRWGNGGRLYSGEELALFYRLINAGYLNEARLTNDHLDFPYTHEKYNVGAYFALYLAQRFGMDDTNLLFKNHAKHYINPFLVNKTFASTFGMDYSFLIREFLRESGVKAKSQKWLTETSPQSKFYYPLNSDQKQIFFLTYQGVGLPTLNVVDRQSKKWVKESQDLPLGKVFHMPDGHYVVAASGQVGRDRIYFSLWREGNFDLRAFRSKIVLDQRQGKTLWLDPGNAYARNDLYLDEQRVGEAHSSALLSTDGEALYFKQQGDVRTLYKGQKALFSLNTYYSKLVDYNAEEIYFISNTLYGSSLYAWNKGQIWRLSDSDAIIDARQAADGQFLVVEVGPNGYQYKWLPPTAKKELPQRPHYFFESDNTYQLTAAIEKEGDPTGAPAEQRRFRSWRDLRFSGINLQWSIYQSENILNVSGQWADPLNYNDLTLFAKRDEMNGNDSYHLSYWNRAYNLNWFGSVQRVHHYPSKSLKTRVKDVEDKLWAGLQYHLMGYGRHNIYIMDKQGPNISDGSWENYSSILYQWGERSTFLDYYPINFWQARLAHLREDNNLYHSAASLTGSVALGKEFYLRLEGLYRRSNQYEMSISQEIEDGPTIQNGGYSVVSSRTKNGGKGSAELSKTLELSYYFSAFPISLRRLAPKLLYNYFYYQRLGQSKLTTFSEYGAGVNLELLLVHLLPCRFETTMLKRAGYKYEILTSLGYNRSF